MTSFGYHRLRLAFTKTKISINRDGKNSWTVERLTAKHINYRYYWV